MLPFSRQRMLTVLFSAALCYLGIATAIYLIQRQLQYYPDRQLLRPASYNLGSMSEHMLKSSDGTHVVIWERASAPSMPTIVYFHGNGGHLGYRQHIFSEILRQGYGLIALEYRGYGTSEGMPSEEGFYADGRAAIQYALNEQHIPNAKLILYGESIGSGVAVQMATETEIGALVLQSPFTSATDIAAATYPWLPVRLLMKDRFESLSKIGKVNAPLLVLHGEADSIVPAAQGKALLEAANGAKHGVFFPGRNHNDLDPEALVNAMTAFLSAEHVVPE